MAFKLRSQEDPYVESRLKNKEASKSPGYKKSSGAMSFEEYGNKNPIVKAAIQLMDPTGISSHGDVKKAWNDKKFNSDDIIEPLSALPVVGRIPKSITSALKVTKGVIKATKLAKIANEINKVSSKTNVVGKTISKLQAGEAVNSVIK
jgi:hypothetical protein